MTVLDTEFWKWLSTRSVTVGGCGAELQTDPQLTLHLEDNINPEATCMP